MNEEIKALLEELKLPEDTATQISDMLSEAFEKAKADGKAEGKEEGKKDGDSEKDEKIEDLEEQIVQLQESAERNETHLMEKANEYGSHLMAKANEYGELIKESSATAAKEYADYAIEEFITENKERFVATEEHARIHAAFEMIKESFELNGFTVNTDARVDEVQKSLNESTEEYDRVFAQLQEAREKIETLERESIFESSTRELADTQKEKVKALLETVSFDSNNEFSEGLTMFVEQVSAHKDQAPETLIENVDEVKAPKSAVTSQWLGRGLL